MSRLLTTKEQQTLAENRPFLHNELCELQADLEDLSNEDLIRLRSDMLCRVNRCLDLILETDEDNLLDAESSVEEEQYVCEICGFAEGWENTDEVHGDMFGCEVCGKTFCSKCLKDEIGAIKYYEMMQSGEYIRCPDCFKKAEKNVSKKKEGAKQ